MIAPSLETTIVAGEHPLRQASVDFTTPQLEQVLLDWIPAASDHDASAVELGLVRQLTAQFEEAAVHDRAGEATLAAMPRTFKSSMPIAR